MRFGSVPPRNWQKAHGTMISHEKSTNDISNIVNVIYGGMLALRLGKLGKLLQSCKLKG